MQRGHAAADRSRAEGVAPSSKVTVPVAPEGTVAVKVTLAPKVDGFSEDARATVLAVLFTVWISADEVEPL